MLLTLIIPLIISYYPTVLVHGIGGNAQDLHQLRNVLETQGVDAYSIQIGNGKIDSIIWDANKQCAFLNASITELNITREKINLIGISQGGLLCRCYVEKYSHINKAVNTLVTYGTPHMGVYIQDIRFSYFSYWKDPFHHDTYLEDNQFLVYINNEKEHSNQGQYKSNLLSLTHFLIVWSNLDAVIYPRASSRFEFYNISLAEERKELAIVPLINSDTFIRDSLGLRTLKQTNVMDIVQYPCLHNEFKDQNCFQRIFPNISTPLINRTLSIL